MSKELTLVYKIRNKSTGQYAKSGTSKGRHRWTKQGKVFTSQTLKLHLAQFRSGDPDYPYSDDVAEVVQYILREEETDIIAPSQFT